VTETRHLQARDERGNLIGDVVLADGTTEAVDALDAWAEAFEADDNPRPLSPARRGRPSLANDEGESPRVTVRLPRALLAEADAAAKTLGGNRADLVRAALEQYLHPTPAVSASTAVRGRAGLGKPPLRATAAKARTAGRPSGLIRSGRSAVSGQFVGRSTVNRSPRTTVTEITNGRGGSGVNVRSGVTGRYVTSTTGRRRPDTTVAER
jgi:hypothetical protein